MWSLCVFIDFNDLTFGLFFFFLFVFISVCGGQENAWESGWKEDKSTWTHGGWSSRWSNAGPFVFSYWKVWLGFALLV